MEHHDDWTCFRLGRLDPRRFEELCLALLSAEGHSELRHWGAAGADGGVDILSRGPDGRRWVTQCKRHSSLSAGGAMPELEKVIADPPDPPPQVYRLVATCTISRTTDEALQTAAAAAPFPLELAATWAESELVALLRDRYPELHREFIGPIEPARVPFWNVPNRGDYFTGREEILAELATRLEKTRATALTQAISGLGGVGKSQTAIEYCHRHRPDYEGGVFWVDASSPESLLAQYAEVALARGLVGREVPVNDAAGVLLRHLASRSGWLMVLDNADDPDAVRSLLPPNTNGHVLVTTRAAAPGIGHAAPIEVDVLPRDQATGFLLERGRREEAERPAAQQLAEALGRLPLALEQAGAYLARHPIAVSDYLASFEQRRLDLLDRYPPEQGQYAATVATTWEISFRKVEEASPAAAEALPVCGYLAPDRVPMQLFTATGDLLGPALGALAEEVSTDPLALHEGLIEPLIRYSLARYDSEDGGVLSFHRLVQEVIRRRVQPDGREPTVYEQGHRAVDTCFPEDPESPAAWPAASRWLPHVQRLLTLWQEQSEEPTWDPTDLWIKAARYAWAAGRATEARRLNEEALAVRRRVLGEEHPDTLSSMNNLAATFWSLGETAAARDLHVAVLSVRRRVLGEEHPDTLSSMNNLAATLLALGETAAARDHLKATVSVNRLVFGEEHPNTLQSMNNLAESLRVLGETAAARDLHESVLSVRRRILGEEHPDTLSSMSNLALTLRVLGETAAARELLEAAVSVSRRVLGEEHPNTLQLMNNLAATLMDLGETAAARDLHESVLSVRRRILGEVHPDTLTSMHNLCFLQAESDGMEVDRELVSSLLLGVRKLPEGTPIRVAAEAHWAKQQD